MKNWLRKLYLRLPAVRELRQVCYLAGNASLANINTYRELLLRGPKYVDSRKLNHFEVQVFSQNFEDGILAEIFRRIGVRSRVFVELGVGDGIENNTVFWLFQGWRGFWVDGDAVSMRQVAQNLAAPIKEGRLTVKQAIITAENVPALLKDMEVPFQMDLLSIDIDRNTYHVWAALHMLKPRVVVVEYNATFPPSIDWVVDYQPNREWDRSMYFGASLSAFARLGQSLGYELVGCDTTGTNAFFIRRDEALDLFASPFTAENHYEPPRYWMCRREAHPRRFSELRPH